MQAVLPRLGAKSEGFSRGPGYIAEGIVTENGCPKARQLVVLTADTLEFVCVAVSDKNGRYLIPALDDTRKYLIFARNSQGSANAAIRDHVSVQTDLTITEQQQFLKSRQSNY